MKKLIILVAVLFTVSAQAEILFQKTYTVDGMKASEIEQAFGPKIMKKEDGAVDKVGFGLKLISSALGNGSVKKKGKQEYPIKCVWGGTTFYADADIILQAKDDKYRVTISNAFDSDSGKALIKMNPKFVNKCTAQIEQWADAKHEQVKSLAF
tara:strand:+ start:46 stop:504 length:459 start_codon:yes stop_codon:yes gene_type:complete